MKVGEVWVSCDVDRHFLEGVRMVGFVVCDEYSCRF